ncbi:hypothetical protein FOZ61_003954 [Perkinsus olseni]|uniref:Uncharacterized protein n=1 Tax=Perkinsus olseni TaxID=32597 RepID=A0A7J6KLZ2_PEROL|nr:hypothetical protein FOZ61_003954 [Perkinsus olseni]
MDTTSPAGSSALVAAVRPSPLPPVVITMAGQEADEQVARVREVKPFGFRSVRGFTRKPSSFGLMKS